MFRRLLARVAERLDALAPADRVRRGELSCYLGAVVYHARDGGEQEELYRIIEASTKDEQLRRKVRNMKKTMAEVLQEKGREEGRLETARRTLIRQLERRFGDLAEETRAVIEATSDPDRLDAWLDRVLTAERLEGIGIGG